MPQNEWICLMKFVLKVIVVCRRNTQGGALKAQSAVKIHRTFSPAFLSTYNKISTHNPMRSPAAFLRLERLSW